MKAVYDTNILIPAFMVADSRSERAFRLAQYHQVELYTSVAILTEVAETLRGKFQVEESDIQTILRLISRVAHIVKPRHRVNVLADEPDNRILECAAEARVDVVVTGDRGLLKLKRFEGIPIIRLVGFLRMFPAAA